MSSIDLNIEYDDSDDSAIVYVFANLDNKRIKFVLDTGCAISSLMNSEYSEKLEKVSSRDSAGAIGTETFDVVNVSEFHFGPISRKNILFSRANSKKIDKNLLGMNVLADSSLEVSYKNKSLKFTGSPSKEVNLESILPDPKGLQPYIQIECGKHNLVSLWDTGGGITLVDTGFVSENPDLFEVDGHSVGTDSTGNSMVTPNYILKGLKIGGYEFEPHQVAAIDFSHVNSRSKNPVSIGIGFSTIKQADWYFDLKNNKWAITQFHSR